MSKQNEINKNTPPRKIHQILKIAVINVLCIILILFTIDYSLYLKFKKEYINYHKDILEIYPPCSYLQNYKNPYNEFTHIYLSSKENKLDYFREIKTQEYNDKKSILIFGCSFAHGSNLDDNQTINSKLSTATKRNIYNFSICGGAIQHMLFFIKDKRIYDKVKTNPEYAIYVFLPFHIDRLQKKATTSPMTISGFSLRYKLKDNILKLEKSLLEKFSKSFIVKALIYQQDLQIDNQTEENRKYNSELAKRLFIESKKELENKYPNIKFVILRYEIEDEEDMEMPEIWEELENEGIIVIKSSDLIGRKYKYNTQDSCKDLFHPSEYAWNLLIPKLIKELNL